MCSQDENRNYRVSRQSAENQCRTESARKIGLIWALNSHSNYLSRRGEEGGPKRDRGVSPPQGRECCCQHCPRQKALVVERFDERGERQWHPWNRHAAHVQILGVKKARDART